MNAIPSPHRYRLLLSYDGTDFCGWQIQPNGISIQSLLQKALQTLSRQDAHPVSAGRTDAGVHARGQVVHVDLARPLENLDRALASLNGLLPHTIRVLGIESCSDQFHSRYSARRKIYHYYLHTRNVEDPFARRYRWFVRHNMDRELLSKACNLLVGTHDFKSLANENHRGVAAIDSIRTLFRVDPVSIEGGICLEFEGDGFLYKMVRNCTGLMVEVATGKRPLEEISSLLQQQKRTELGYCAPASGLFLHKVIYSPESGPSSYLQTDCLDPKRSKQESD